MSNETKNTIVPKLRFSEFKDSGEWKTKKLGQCLLQHPEYGINAAAVPYSNKLPNYLRITDISEDGFYLRNQKVSVEKEVTEANYLKEGDLVFARTGASVGKSYKYRVEDGDLVFAGFLIRVRPNREILNSDLLFQYLSTEQYWRWVNFTSTRSGQPGINSNEYSSMPILLPPSIEEQKKIADCLSSLDELITSQSQKLQALKTHKKGLMQQLFPAEGEMVPMLRFTEFKHDGEWEEKKIGEFAQVTSGGTPDSTNEKYWNGNIPWMNSGELNNKKIFSVSNRITLLGLEESSTKLIPLQCVLIGLAGQGKTRGTAAINYIQLCTNQSIAAIHPNKNAFISEFLYHKLDSMYDQLRALSTGEGGRGGLNLQIIKSIEVRLPSLKEQQKIADCLSSLDEQISAQTEKIEALKTHKKGLMQALFPSAL